MDVRRLADWIGGGFVAFGAGLLALLGFASRLPDPQILTSAIPIAAIAMAAFIAAVVVSLRRLAKGLGELARREAQTRHEATHDSVSRLPNRRNFMRRLESCLASNARGVAVACVDIDGFKEITDAYGQEVADRLILALARRLSTRCLREEDFLARFEGDQLALQSTPVGADGASALARRAARAFAVPFVIDGHTVRISASIGAASVPSNGATTADLMRCADLALNEAKRQGRDRIIVYSPEIERRRLERRALERDLRAALKSDQLRLCYQPIVACGTNRIVALEALLRWSHPARGDVSPGAFIPIAEECGLMPELGDWVLQRAMGDAKRWPALQISINLSPVQIRHVDLEALLRRMLDEHRLEAQRFVLEITEGVALDANGRTKRMLEAVRALGFKTALDDFGAGHSSLAYLHDFKFDKIKIDRSLTNGGESARAIAQAAATLGRALKMDVVAEGVETEAEAVLMRHLGCTELQGYYFSRPVEAADVGALLRKYERPRLTYAAVTSGASAARAS